MAPFGASRAGLMSVADDDIPDSVLRQRWDEGSGDTVEDEDGDNDGNIEGASWHADGDLEGGYGLSFDGSDAVVADAMSELGSDGDYLLCITIDADSSSGDQTFTQQYSGDTVDLSIGYRDGHIGVRNDHNDDSGRRIEDGETTDRIRVGVYCDNDSDEIRIYKQGSREDDSDGTEPSSAADSGLVFGARTDQANGLDGIGDHPVIYDEPEDPDDAAQADYNDQPWS